MPGDINTNGNNNNKSLSDIHKGTDKKSDGALTIISMPDSPRPCPPAPPPSPAEDVAPSFLDETEGKENAVLGNLSDISGSAANKSKPDLSGMTRYQKQRFWGWLCDEDGRVDVTHPAFTGFRPH